MEKSTLRRTILFNSAVILLAFSVISGLIVVGSFQLNKEVEDTQSHQIPRLLMIYEVGQRASAVRFAVQRHIMADEDSAMKHQEGTILKMYLQNQVDLKSLLVSSRSGKESDAIRVALILMEQYAGIRAPVLFRSRNGNKKEAERLNESQLIPLSGRFQDQLAKITSLIRQESLEKVKMTSMLSDKAKVVAIGGMAVGIFLTVLLGRAIVSASKKIGEIELERQVLAKELESQRPDFRHLIESAPEAVAILDTESRIKHVNREFTQLFGYSIEESILQCIDDLIVGGSDRSKAADLGGRVLDGTRVNLEAVRYRKDGTAIDVSILAIPTKLMDGTDGIYVIYRDIASQKKNEADLRYSEERLRILFEYAPDAYYLHDLKGTLIDGNKAAEELTGYSREALIGKNLLEIGLLRMRDIPRAAGLLARLAAGKAVEPMEFEMCTKTRGDVIVELRAYPIEIHGKSVVLGIARDITQRRAAEKQLKENEEKFRSLFENAGDGIAIIGDGQFVDCNDRILKILQCSREDFIGKRPDDLSSFAQPEANSFSAMEASLLRNNVPERSITFDWKLRRKSGSDVDAEVSLSPFTMSGRVLVQAMVRDITEKKQMIQRLQQLSVAIEQSPSMVVITDLTSRIEYVNERFLAVTGFNAEEVLGKTPKLLKSGLTPESTYKQLWETIADGRIWRGRFCNRRKNGDIYWEEASVASIRDSHGKALGYVGVKIDISERMAVEEELLRAKESAESALRAKSDFLAMMSHEIRTPMNGVIGMAGLLTETELTEQQRDYVNTIQTSGQLLLGVINEILDFSKIESGKLDLEYQVFDLHESVVTVTDLLSTKAAEKGVELVVSIGFDVPVRIFGDVTRIRQILINLVSNAIKFTQIGEVVVSVRVISQKEDRVELEFEVSDTGIGIPADKLDRLFRPFSQVDTSTTRRFGGTGLGLAICSRLVDLMGGKILVDSKEGSGSRFSFVLSTERAAEEQQPVPFEFSNRTVLIVDDNLTNRRILKAQLTRWKLHVIEADCGHQALQILGSLQPIDFIILDMQMPKMDGVSLARHIADLPDRGAIPRILLSSMGRPRDPEDQCLFTHCLAKPVRISVLQQCVKDSLSGRAGQARTPLSNRKLESDLGSRLPARILLVEDNVINQKVALHAFSRMGYRVDVANNGLDAVQATQRDSYDLVFMDIQMPEMDGLEATRVLREQGNRSIVIAMTANAMESDRERCMSVGMNDFVSKPVQPLDLQTAIKKWLRSEAVQSDAA